MKRRFLNIVMVVLALLHSLFRGRSSLVDKPLRFVVIYPTNNIGDMVCATPIFRAIKESVPGAHLTVIGSPRNRELLEHNRDVDEYLVATQSITKLIGIVRAERFDAGVVVNPDTINLGTLLLGGVKAVSSFILKKEYLGLTPRPYRAISRLVHTIEYTPGKYIPVQNLALLIPFGIEVGNAEKSLGFSPEGLGGIVRALKDIGIQEEERVVAIAPGAGSDLKRWPADRFATLSNYIHEKYGMPVVIVGGPGDQEAVQEMLEALNRGVRYWLPGPQSLDELKATLARAYLVIGNDSGAVHVGEAVGTRTLTIAGATDVAEHMQEDSRHRIVKGSLPGNLYQSYIGDETKMDPEVARKQMESVTVEVVTPVADELIGGGLD